MLDPGLLVQGIAESVRYLAGATFFPVKVRSRSLVKTIQHVNTRVRGIQTGMNMFNNFCSFKAVCVDNGHDSVIYSKYNVVDLGYSDADRGPYAPIPFVSIKSSHIPGISAK